MKQLNFVKIFTKKYNFDLIDVIGYKKIRLVLKTTRFYN